MYPLFETIRLENGILQNVGWHQSRYVRSYCQYYGRLPMDRITGNIDIPEFCRFGTYKTRISYNETSKKVEFEKYDVKEINTLKIVEDNTIDYSMKYTDRSKLLDLLERKENCDNILIVRHGMITDSSFSNIVFFDGHKWVTPSNPLLKGTSRERLLKSGTIEECDIRITDIRKYISFKLINSMRDFGVMGEIDVDKIL